MADKTIAELRELAAKDAHLLGHPPAGPPPQQQKEDSMKRFIAMTIAALIAAFTIGIASPASVGASGGWGKATIQDVNVSCADPATGAYTVTWVAHVTDLSRHNTPTVWSLDGQTTSVSNPIFVTTTYVRYQMSWYNREPVITVIARIGFSQPILNDRAPVPGYCLPT